MNQFVEDPLCQFRFTCSAYRDFFRVMLDLKKKRWVKKMPASLPLFLVSGDEDPVGNYGKGVRKLFEEYHRMGMEDVEMKLYDGARHEILNELGRETVYMDLSSGFCGTAADKAIDFYQFLISICFQFFDRPFGRQISQHIRLWNWGTAGHPALPSCTQIPERSAYVLQSEQYRYIWDGRVSGESGGGREQRTARLFHGGLPG